MSTRTGTTCPRRGLGLLLVGLCLLPSPAALASSRPAGIYRVPSDYPAFAPEAGTPTTEGIEAVAEVSAAAESGPVLAESPPPTSAQLEPPSPRRSPEPPTAVDFELAWLSRPDASGLFRGSVLVNSRLADVPVRVLLTPTEGVEILEAPAKLSGRARRGRPVTFGVVGRILPSAPRPAGLAVELRFRYPAAAAAAAFQAALTPGAVETGPAAKVLEKLETWAATDRGGPVLKVHRSFFIAADGR